MVWSKAEGVKALVDAGIQSVPQLFLKPPEQLSTLEEEPHTLDVIDLSEDEAVSIPKIKHASENLGFFQVVNHGIDLELMNQVLKVTHQFFDMPLEDKMTYYNTDPSSPVRFGTSFNPFREKVLDWSDNLIHRFLPQHQGPHPWPQKPAAYREIAEEYLNQASVLAKKLNRAMSLGLGLDGSYLENAFGKQHVAVRVNYYPPCPDPQQAVGLSSHSDVGGLTILLQDNDVAGLQVKIQDQWKTIKPIPGALVVNICDQLQIFSNGMYKSVDHRAILNTQRARVSVAIFCDPGLDVEVAPIPELLDDTHPALYSSSTYQNYLSNVYANDLAGKAFVESQRIA